jgi:hypothetical protein
MLRKNVYQQMKNDPKNAAKYLARYTLYAGMGYGMLDSGPRALIRDQDVEPEDFLLGAAEQVAAVHTLNRVGAPYDVQKIEQEPIEAIMESLLPPTGYVGAAGKDVKDLLLALLTGGQKEFNPADMETLKRLPIVGQAIRYGWIDIGQEVHEQSKESKSEKWKKVKKQVME